MNLTPLGIVLLVLSVLLGIAGQWSETLGLFPWWRVAVVLLVVALTYEFLRARRLTVTADWRGFGRLFLGRQASLQLELESSSRHAVSVQLAPVFPPALTGADSVETVRLDGRGPQSVAVTVRPVLLGDHRWPVLPIRVKGALGLAWWSRTLHPAADIHVLPDTLGPKASVAGSADAGSSGQAALGGGRELHHLRSYRDGDPRHTIDWKATARASRLITRVFSEDQHLEVVIAIDAGRTSRTEIDGMSQFGHYANLAARFAEYCAAGDDQVGLVVFADKLLCAIPPGRGLASVMRVRRALTGLAPSAVESDVLEAALGVQNLVRRRCLVVILTDLYERSATSRLVQSARLLAPKHLPMMVGLLSNDVSDMAAGEARDWLDPYRGMAARDYQRHVEANVARLTRLGALAMTAHPAELDRKVLNRYRLLRARHRV